MTKLSISKTLIVTILISILSLLSGWGVVQFGADFRYLLFLVLLLLIIGIIAIGGRRAIRVGFVIWIWMFILGYRTIQITSYLKLHPLVILLALLFAMLLFVLKSEGTPPLRLPKPLWFFSPFWVWGFIIGAARGLEWANMLADALNFIFLIPLLLIMLYLAREPRFWKTATLTFLASGALICLLGTIEFYVPAFRSLLPGLIQTDVEGLGSASGFLRASFAFFGATPAVIISALALPMVWLVPKFFQNKLALLLAFSVTVILGIGIYISGTRAAWLMVVAASVLLAFFSFRWVGVGLSAAVWGIVGSLLPEEAWNLINSLTTPLASGVITDSSLLKRFGRQQDALTLTIENPLGVGWTGSGWVHGDFTQVAANLGIFAGILFLGWYLHTLYRGWKYYRSAPQDWLFQAILTCFVLGGIVLATEGIQVLTQFIMPVWFVWGLMEAYLQMKKLDHALQKEP